MRPVAVETRPIPQDLLQRLGRFDATICPGGKDCRGGSWGVLCLSRRGPKLFPNRNFHSGLLVSNLVGCANHGGCAHRCGDRKSTRLNSSHVASSYAVVCLKKKRLFHCNN